VILPKDNEKDLKEIPESVLKEIKVVQVETMEEVLEIALERPIFKKKAPASEGNKESFEEPKPQDVSQQGQSDPPGVH